MSSPAHSATEPEGPLTGVTVLDLATVGPAARCSMLLADYGATVIKVGAPPRKSGVQVKPLFYAYGARRYQKQVRLDLKAPEGKAAFLALARRADVVIESYRPGVVRRLGIGYDEVHALNSGVVYCSTSGYGQDGPASGWAGHDINYLGMGGYLACTEPGVAGKPPIPGATIADSAAGGMHAALAILAALQQRTRTGEGQYLDVSVTEGVLSLMSLYLDEHLATGAQPGPGHGVLTGRYAYYDTYQASDGKWLSVGAIEPHFYRNLCNALGLEQWAEHQNDDAVQDAIREDFRAAFRRKTRDAWVAQLSAADTCVAPVYEIEEVARDPHLRARGAVSRAVHPEHGEFEQTAPALAGMVRNERPTVVRDADRTDTLDLLREAGLGSEEIEKLREAGIVA